jgi:hypothetical protein
LRVGTLLRGAGVALGRIRSARLYGNGVRSIITSSAGTAAERGQGECGHEKQRVTAGLHVHCVTPSIADGMNVFSMAEVCGPVAAHRLTWINRVTGSPSGLWRR